MSMFLDNFSLFHMAYSWGGFESLILANQPEELNSIRPAGEVDFSGTLVRVHIGLEDVGGFDCRSGGRVYPHRLNTGPRQRAGPCFALA